MKSSSQTPRNELAMVVHGSRAGMASPVAAQGRGLLRVVEARNLKGSMVPNNNHMAVSTGEEGRSRIVQHAPRDCAECGRGGAALLLRACSMLKSQSPCTL